MVAAAALDFSGGARIDSVFDWRRCFVAGHLHCLLKGRYRVEAPRSLFPCVIFSDVYEY